MNARLLEDRLRRAFGLDVPFRATDVKPPRAMSVSVKADARGLTIGMLRAEVAAMTATVRLANAQRDYWQKAADDRKALLERVVSLSLDPDGARELRRVIRRHLREADRA